MVTAAALSKILIGSALSTVGWQVASIVVNLAISSLLGKILAPSAPKSGVNAKGLQNVVRDNILPRRIIYGEAITGGPYAVIETTGPSNVWLNMVIVLAGHPVEDVLGVKIEDEYIDISGTGGTTNDSGNDLDQDYWLTGNTKYGSDQIGTNTVQIIKNLGWGTADFQYVTNGSNQDAQDDRARAALIENQLVTLWTQPSTTRDSSTGLYTDESYKLTNCAHIYLRFRYDPEIFTSFPKLKFHVRGKRLYNPYLDASLVAEGADSTGTHDINDPDTWEWSQDWTLCVLDYLTNSSYGLAAKTSGLLSEINWEEAIRSYLSSSELITNGLPSPDTDTTERYTTNGILETNSTPISNMEALLTSGAGSLVYAQGEYAIRPGVYRLPNTSLDIINEDMIVSALSIRTHTPRSEIFNKVGGVFVDKGYEETGTTIDKFNNPRFEPSDFGLVDPLDSSGVNPYEVIDGEEIIREFDYPLTTREFEAQRLARIELERVRRGLSISFEANMQVLKYSVGDTVYLEILSDSKYANESFFNRLGLDDSVQTLPTSPGTPYYKQFKIVEMQYTENSTIFMSMIEESEAIYDWNDGFASPTEEALESEIIVDDPYDTVLEPSFVVNSPFSTIVENIATESGTTVTTLIRWSAASRGSIVNALDQAHTQFYRLEYGVVDNPSLTEGNRVSTWIFGGNKTNDHTQITQGPLALETLYKDGVDYDFRVQAVTYSGRTSDWAYYSTDIGSDYTPSPAPATSAVNVYLTNVADTITADNDGTNYTLPTNPVSQYKVFEGSVDYTDDSTVTYSIVGASTKNGLSIAISDTIGTKGQISLSGASWTTDSENFTVRAAFNGNNYDLVYSISKALEGAAGTPGADGADGVDGEVGWGHDLIFTATDADTVAWTGGSLWTAGGATYPIDSAGGNTGNMTTRTYIYFDGSSPVDTNLSITTSAQTAVGPDKILVAVAENTSDSEAFFQVFGGYGGLLITGNEVVANSITANSIAASFYEGRTFTGGIFQTRKLLSQQTSPFTTTPRASLSEAEQLQIQDASDNTIFSVTDNAGSAEISIVGDFLAGSLNTAQMYSSAGIADLRGRLGVTDPVSATGGIATLTTIPQTLSTTSADYELDVDIYNTGLNENSLTFTITDSDYREGTSSNPYTAPTWSLQFFYSTGSPHSWTAVPGGNFSVTGTTAFGQEDTNPTIFWNSFNLSATRSVDWTPASPFSSSDPIYYMIRVSLTSGDSNNPRLTACTASEAVVGSGGATDLDGLTDVTITSVATDEFLQKSAGDWINVTRDEANIGYNTMPIKEQDTAYTFAEADKSYLIHKDSGVGISYTCDSETTISQGSTWVVHNDDTEDLTITTNSPCILYWLAAGSAPQAGDVTISQGGIVTVYKYADDEYWAWGTKDGGNSTTVNAGSADYQMLVWDQTTDQAWEVATNMAWNESTQRMTLGTSGHKIGRDTDTVLGIYNGADDTLMRFTDTDGGVVIVDEAVLRLSAGNQLEVWGSAGGRSRIWTDAANYLDFTQDLSAVIGAKFQYPLNLALDTSAPTALTDFVQIYGIGAAGFNAELMTQSPDGRSLPLTNYRELVWRFHDSTVSADPGSTFMRADTEDLSTMSALYVDDLDYAGQDSAWFWSMVQVDDTLLIHQNSDEAKWLHATVDSITDNTGWYTIGITPVAYGSSGANTHFNHADSVSVGVFPNNLIATGGGGNVSNTGTPVNNQLAVWTDATTIEGDADLVWDGTSLDIRSGNSFSIWSSGNVDEFKFSGSGSVLSIEAVTSGWLDIDGFTQLVAGTVDADFDALTATSYGGILEADLIQSTGTPANDQLSVWTNANTVEGSTNLTYDGSTFKALNYVFDVNQIVDSSVDNYVLTYDNASGEISLEAPSGGGGGNVSNTGTPVNNQVAIWADATTIEGDANFTWDGTQIVLPTGGSDNTPTIAFGDGQTGFWESSDNNIGVSLSTVTRWTFSGSGFQSNDTGGAFLRRATATSLIPALAFVGDTDTGLGFNAADQLSATAGGKEMMRFVETGVSTTDQVIIAPAGIIGAAATPALAFGDGDTGFYESADDTLVISVAGAATWDIASSAFQGTGASRPALQNEAASSTNPTLIPSKANASTGIGSSGAEVVSIIGNSKEYIRTQNHASTGNTTAAEIRSHNTTTFYDIGFNLLPIYRTNGSGTVTLAAEDCGKATLKNNTTAFTINVEASGTTDFPIGGMTVIVNGGASADITIGDNSTAIWYLDGSSSTDVGASCTIGPGGNATIWRTAAATYYIWGTGITI